MPRFVIAVHGGCGAWGAADAGRALKGLRAALRAGFAVLRDGGTALDAVCAAVVVLEDDPLFNAGTGSVLNRDGEVEMDASVMVSDGLRCGGVAALRRVRNPVLVARRVMEDTPHVLLAGEGALAFARAAGFPDYDPVTPERRARYRASAGHRGGNTVGAVARDAAGCYAAATSTGGTSLKLPGRVGDSPIPGAGNYAMPGAAASATGTGELMMRTLAAKTACDAVAAGSTALRAVRTTVAAMPLAPGDAAALIAIDRTGRVGARAAGGRMPCGWQAEGDRAAGTSVA